MTTPTPASVKAVQAEPTRKPIPAGWYYQTIGGYMIGASPRETQQQAESECANYHGRAVFIPSESPTPAPTAGELEWCCLSDSGTLVATFTHKDEADSFALYSRAYRVLRRDELKQQEKQP